MTNRIKIGEFRPPYGNAAIYQSDDLQQVFADGIQGLSFTGSLAKIDFFQTTLMPLEETGKPIVMGEHSPESQEQRLVTLRVALPSRLLLEFCINSLRKLKEMNVTESLAKEVATLSALLESVQFTK